MNFNQNRYSAIEVNLGSEKLPVNFDTTYFSANSDLLTLI